MVFSLHTNEASKSIFIVLYLQLFVINVFGANSNTSIYSDEFIAANNNVSFKNYFEYDNTNYTDILFVEFTYDNNNTLPYFKISVYWFTNLTSSDFPHGLFYGIANTNISQSSELFSDIVICKIFSVQSRCDDYFMISNGSSIENDFKTSFNPILDYKMVNGSDDLLAYSANSPITSNVSPFSSLLKFNTILPIYMEDNLYDINMNFRNNLTIFFGQLVPSNSEGKSYYDNQSFDILRIYSKNYSEIVSSSNWFNYGFLYSLFFIFILL